jgi:hypothetical protein
MFLFERIDRANAIIMVGNDPCERTGRAATAYHRDASVFSSASVKVMLHCGP